MSETPAPVSTPIPHGHTKGYALGCRCDLCVQARQAANARMRHYMATHPEARERIRRSPARRASNQRYRQSSSGKAAAARARAIQRDSAHIAARRLRDRAFRLAHPERVRARRSAYLDQNRERINAERRRLRGSTASARTAMLDRWPFVRTADQLDPLTATINAAIPRTLPPELRAEVAQDLAVLVLTSGCAITPAAITAAIREYWRRYPLMSGRDRSLDAPRWSTNGDSRDRWIDMLPATTQEPGDDAQNPLDDPREHHANG